MPYAAMTPDQINALGKIKDASAWCFAGVYAGAKVTTSGVNVDKGIPSGVTIKDDCSILFDSKTPKGATP